MAEPSKNEPLDWPFPETDNSGAWRYVTDPALRLKVISRFVKLNLKLLWQSK